MEGPKFKIRTLPIVRMCGFSDPITHCMATRVDDTLGSMVQPDFETRPSAYYDFITSDDRFYIRSHSPTASIDMSTWKLKIDVRASTLQSS